MTHHCLVRTSAIVNAHFSAPSIHKFFILPYVPSRTVFYLIRHHSPPPSSATVLPPFSPDAFRSPSRKLVRSIVPGLLVHARTYRSMDLTSLPPFVQQQTLQVLQIFHDAGTFNNIDAEYKRNRILIKALHAPRGNAPVSVEIKYTSTSSTFTYHNLDPHTVSINDLIPTLPPAPTPDATSSTTLPPSTSISTNASDHRHDATPVIPDACSSSTPLLPDAGHSAATLPVTTAPTHSPSSSFHEPAWGETATYIEATTFPTRHLAGVNLSALQLALIDDGVLTTSIVAHDDRLTLSFSFSIDQIAADTVTARFQQSE